MMNYECLEPLEPLDIHNSLGGRLLSDVNLVGFASANTAGALFRNRRLARVIVALAAIGVPQEVDKPGIVLFSAASTHETMKGSYSSRCMW